MAAVARYLADTSVLARLHHPEVAAVLAPLIESGVGLIKQRPGQKAVERLVARLI